MSAAIVIKELKKFSSKDKAKVLQGFFKTKKGEYGEGDVFIGITVPNQRKVAKNHKDLKRKDIKLLLESKIHEHRLTGLLILLDQYKKGSEKDQKSIYSFYLKNTKYINNWDLVDLTAPNIIGKYLLNKPRDILYKLAESKSLWERRISMLACFTFIRNQEIKDTLKIAQILLKDEHDLIHKAVGWMLRELGKRVDQGIEEKFLKKYYKIMPRTMLRYAIERFEEFRRKKYLTNKI